jgi:SHS2 domain-containing protein
VRLEAHNESLPRLFEDIAYQLFGHLIDPKDVGEALREKVAVEGESLGQLLREWVATLLEFVQTQHMVFGTFRVTELKTTEKGPYSLRSEAVGELLDAQRHTLKQDVGRLACREANLTKDAKGYHAEIALDQ